MRVQIAKCSWGCADPSTPDFIWNKLHLFTNNLLCLDSSHYATYTFQIIDLNQCRFPPPPFLFLNRSSYPDEWDCIIFLIWAACVLFNFDLKQIQWFLVWSFTENTSFISFHGTIWFKNSGTNKFKIIIG